VNLISIDFETFYSKDYSLSKTTTEEYIRNSQFEIIGVAVSVNGDAPQWFSGTREETRVWLRQFDWEHSMAVAHNAVFDMAILNWICGMKPLAIADTLSMARAIHGTEVGGSLASLALHYKIGVKGTEVLQALGKRRSDFSPAELAAYGSYCCNDVALTVKLFEELGDGFSRAEMKLIDLTVRMFTEPKLTLHMLDLIDHLSTVKLAKEKLLERVGITREELMSNPKFAEVLRKHWVTPPTKISLRTNKETYAFAKSDEGFKALLNHHDSDVQALVAARLGVKSTLEETRTQRFIDVSGRGLMPVPLRYYAAHTGRWGGDDKLNLHNLPRISPLKKAILAPDGYVLIDADSSQIEARTLAWMAGQDDLVTAFANGEDVYTIMAGKIFDIPPSIVDTNQRFIGKVTVLGCGYGMGADKFRAMLLSYGRSVKPHQAEHIIDVYRRAYPKITALWESAREAVSAMAAGNTCDLGKAGVLVVHGTKGIELPNGMFLKYPNLRKVLNETANKYEYVYDNKRGKSVTLTRIYGGKLVENICQALARIVIGEQLIQVAAKYPVVLTVHDSIAFLAPADDWEEGLKSASACMRTTPAWAKGLPLTCEVGYGASYDAAGKKKSIEVWGLH